MLEGIQKRLNLRLKIFLVVLPLVTLPLMLVGSLSYLYMRENSLRILESQMELALRSLNNEISRELVNARANLELFATNEVIGQYLGLPEATRYRVMQPAVLNILSDYRRAFPHYVEIGLYLPDGRADTLVSDEFAAPLNKQDFHKRLISEAPKFMEKFYFSREGGGHIDYVIAQRVVAPDIDASGSLGTALKPQGYMVIVLRINNIKSRLASALDLPEGLIAMTSSTGDPYFSTVVLNEKTTGLLSRVVNSGIGRLRSISVDQSYYLGGFYRVADQLLIVGVITHEAISKVVSPIIWGIFWSVLGISLLSFLLIYWGLNNMLVTPLLRLKNQLLDFRAGREMVNPDQSDNEFGELYHLVSEMAESQRMVRTRIKEMSYFDPLTGLPNRQAFTKILDKAVSLASRQGHVFAVLYIDLTEFKQINIQYGKVVGDQLVKDAAQRIVNVLRLSDEVSRQVMSEEGTGDQILVRTGGDEFTVLVRDIKKAHQASVVAKRIIDQFARPFEIKGQTLTLDLSIGIAIYPLDGMSPDLLLKSADLAMYDAKQLTGSRYRFFTHALNASAEKRIAIESALYDALENKAFEVCLQPRSSASKGIADQFEATIRWSHAQHGTMTQAQFMSVLDDAGKTSELEDAIVEAVCGVVKSLADDYSGQVKVAMNVTLDHVISGRLHQALDFLLEKYSINGSLLTVEIAEHYFRGDVEESEILECFRQLRLLGVSLCLDDFGQQTISLDVLKRFGFDSVNLAEQFCREIEYDSRNETVLQAVVSLAHSLGMKVVATGIDKQSVIQIVKRTGVDYLQGLYLQAPVPMQQLRRDFRNDIFHASIVPPTDNGVPPIHNKVPPIDHNVPPTDNNVPPTDNKVPPTDNETP